jgi:hypothetical protein
MAHQSVLLAHSVPSVEGGLTPWNDSSVPFDVDDEGSHLGRDQTGADTLKADDVQQVDEANHPSMLEPTPNGPSPMSGSPSASIHDSASMHSLTAVQVTESQQSPSLPPGPDVPPLSDNDSTIQVQRVVGSNASAPLPSRRRSARSRSTVDVRWLHRILSQLITLTSVLHRFDHPTDSLVSFPSSSIDGTMYRLQLVQ